MNVRRVLMTADAAGGVWTYALDLAQSLRDRGIHTTIAVMGPAPSAAQLADAQGLDLRAGNFKLEWMDDPWREVDQAGDWLRALEQEIRPDVVHLNGYAHGSVRFSAPKLVVAHSCVLSWWTAVHGEAAPDSWNEYRKRVGAGLAAADFVVAPSRAMLQAIHLNYGTLCRSDVIPNGRAPRLFRSGPKEPFVLTAGRFWDRAKNLETLDRAAAKLDWPVYAAGEARSAESIRCLGPLSAGELRHWFARASIYALPARYEPFGLSILEAALSGCALVLGDIPSLRENWDGAAVFVPPDDVHGLVEQIRLLARHEDVRRGFQQAARKRAVNFSLDRMTDAYLERYAALRCLSQPAAVFRS